MAVHHLYFLYSFRLVEILGKGALFYWLFGRGGIILLDNFGSGFVEVII